MADNPPCPDCRKKMMWSNDLGGGYQAGWQCNNVRKCGNRGKGYRWVCKQCTNDFCEECYPHKAQCPAGHTMQGFNTHHPNFSCDVCKKAVPQGGPMLGCRTCNYDVCSKCSPICPGGHALKSFQVPNQNFSCDACKNRVAQGSQMWGCRGCNHDVCGRCAGQYVAGGGSGLAGGACNRAALRQHHGANIDNTLAATKRHHDEIGQKISQLHTTTCRDLSSIQTVVVSKAHWANWVNGHADEIMGGHPDSAEARAFKAQMIKSLNMLKIGERNSQDKQIVELDYSSKSSNFVFGYSAVSHYDKDKGDVHVVVSGYGKKWELENGYGLNEAWWREHQDEIKKFCQHGALKQAKGRLM